MNERAKRVVVWTVARMKEPSTWAGIAAMSALAHHSLEPSYAQSLSVAGTMVGGVLASILAEQK